MKYCWKCKEPADYYMRDLKTNKKFYSCTSCIINMGIGDKK